MPDQVPPSGCHLDQAYAETMRAEAADGRAVRAETELVRLRAGEREETGSHAQP